MVRGQFAYQVHFHPAALVKPSRWRKCPCLLDNFLEEVKVGPSGLHGETVEGQATSVSASLCHQRAHTIPGNTLCPSMQEQVYKDRQSDEYIVPLS